MIQKTARQKYEDLPNIKDIKCGNSLDYSLFPGIVKQLVDYAVKTSYRPISEEITLPAVITALAYVVNSKRIVISQGYSKKPPFPNIYTIILAPSGAGKDYPFNAMMDNILCNINQNLETSYDIFEQKYNDDPRPYLGYQETGELNKKDKERLLDQNPIKGFSQTVDSGTDVGFREFTSTYEKFGMGVPMFRIGEFSNYMGSKVSSEKSELLTDFLVAYSRGTIAGKTTGNRTKALKAGDTPCCLLAVTALKMVSEQSQKKALISLLEGGMDRRSTIVYIPERLRIEHTGVDDFARIGEKDQRKLEGYEMAEGLANKVTSIYESIQRGQKRIFSEEGKLMLGKYDNYLDSNCEYAFKYNEFTERISRVTNIACVLATIRNPKSIYITEKDVMGAINYVEYYGGTYEDFAREELKTFAERVYEFVKSKPDGATSMDIRGEGFVTSRDFKKEFDSSVKEINEIADADYKEFVEFPGDRNTKLYKVISKVADETVKTAPIEDDKEVTIMVSGKGIEKYKNKENKTATLCMEHQSNNDYKEVEVKWEDLCEVVRTDSFMPQLHYGTRKAGLYKEKPGGVLMVFDVDDNMTFDEGKAFFEKIGVKSLIVTSMSHQRKVTKYDEENKDKDGNPISPKDKFHILAWLSEPFTGTKDEWKQIYVSIIEDMGIEADMACKNMSRFFFPSVWENTEYAYIDGDGIDWKAYLEKKPKKTDSSIISGKKPLMVRTDGKRMSDEDNRSVEQRVDDYVTKVLGVEKIYEGKSVIGKDGNSVSGRNSALNNIWVYNKRKNNASFADECCRYANRKYCVPNYTDREMDVFLKNKK